MSRLENQSRNRSMDKGEARDSGCRQDETGRSDGRPRPSAALADGSATKVHGGSWASRGEGKVGSGEPCASPEPSTRTDHAICGVAGAEAPWLLL